MKPKILVSRKISDDAEEILKKEFDVTLNLEDKPYTYEELIKLSNEYDGLISTSFDKLDKNFFDSNNIFSFRWNFRRNFSLK